MELFFKLSGAKPNPLKYLKATCLEIFVPKRLFDFSKSKFIFVCFGNFWLVYFVLDLDLVAVDPKPEVSERLPA